MNNRLLAACSAVLLVFSAPAFVHHSGAMFDQTRQIQISGTVTEFRWTNPHSSFKVDVTHAEGKLETWAIEMNSPNNLIRAGWKRTTIKPGDKVTVTVHPLRDGKPGGLYLGITLPDGKTLGGAPASSAEYPSGSAKPDADAPQT